MEEYLKKYKDEYESIKHLTDYDPINPQIMGSRSSIPKHLRIAAEHFITKDCKVINYHIGFTYVNNPSKLKIFSNKKNYDYKMKTSNIFIPISIDLFIYMNYTNNRTNGIFEYLNFLENKNNKIHHIYEHRNIINSSDELAYLECDNIIPSIDFLDDLSFWLEKMKLKLTDEEIHIIRETYYGKRLLIRKKNSIFKKIPSKLCDMIIKYN